MRGAIPAPPPNTSSCRGAYLIRGITFPVIYLTFTNR